LLDAEAVKVIAASPKWTPAEIGRKKVRCRITVPVEFRLQKGGSFNIKR
ncbi:MAG: energy transducer TonB, partial [Bacteroidales bacterium]|nr:energy transducer TonB [Bacteroidales bacterium]